MSTPNIDEKILTKIQKALALYEDNANSNEAQNALLLAQKLMAKYNLSMSDVQRHANKEDMKIVHGDATNLRKNEWYEKSLSAIIAKNFRCFSYVRHRGGKTVIVFVGHKEDVEICKTVFDFAIQALEYHARKYVKAKKKEQQERAGMPNTKEMSIEELELLADERGVDWWEVKANYDSDPGIYKMRLIMAIKATYRGVATDTSGIKNDYIKGFLNGLDAKFREQVDKNNWGLIVVTPKDVEEERERLKLRKASKANINSSGSQEAYVRGYQQGKSFVVPSGSITDGSH